VTEPNGARRPKWLWDIVIPFAVAVAAAVTAYHLIPTSPVTPVIPQVPTQRDAGNKTDLQNPPEPKVQRAIKVHSHPERADVYFNWVLIGQTPTSIRPAADKGLLVVAKKGYNPDFRSINNFETEELNFNLVPEKSFSRGSVLLIIGEGRREAVSQLRVDLAREGFKIRGTEETQEFTREVTRAGGLSHEGVRAWARARFATDLVVSVNVRHQNRDLEKQEYGYPGVGDKLTGIVKTIINIDLDAVDLRSGESAAVVSASGSQIASHNDDGFQKALADASTKAAKLLKQQIAR
jgi:hypothetical protein